MYNKKIKKRELLLGSIVGGVIGASLAVLFTPKSGKKLRKDINVSSKEALEKAGEWKDTLQVKNSEYTDQAIGKGSDFIDKGVELAEKISRGMNEFARIAEDVAEFITETADKTNNLYEDISEKATYLKADVVDTSAEIKDEVVEHTKAVTEDAKDLKEEIKDDSDSLKI